MNAGSGPPEIGTRTDRRNATCTPNYSTTAPPVERLLNRLEGVRATGRDRWLARCPAHDDRSPSLSIRETGDGTVLVHDFAGCSATDILAAVDLTLGDLFPDGPKSHQIQSHKRPRPNPWKVIEAAQHALAVLDLADAKLCQFAPLDDDEREAVARAVRVLNRFQGVRR